MRHKSATLKFKAMHGIELQHVRTEAVSFSPHFHEDFQILVMLDGCLRLTVSGQDHVVTPPAICLVNPMQVHAGGANGWGWECRNFYVSQKLAARLLGGDDQCAPVFPGAPVHDVALARRLTTAHELACADGERSGALIEALAILFRRYAVGALPSGAERMHPGVRMALLHLRARYAEPIRVQTLARMSGLSRFHFLRTFARAIGMTPHAYQIQLRLAFAVRRLMENAPAAEAAAESGFYDQSHLMRALRRSYGLTPAMLKQANLMRNFVQ